MNIPGLTTPKRAGAAIAARRILVHGSADGLAVQASGVTALLIGVSSDIPTDSGKPLDVVRTGLAPVEYGGTITRGAPLTSDSQGRAVAVTLPVASPTYIIGFAEVAGALGDIGSAFLAPTVVTA